MVLALTVPSDRAAAAKVTHARPLVSLERRSRCSAAQCVCIVRARMAGMRLLMAVVAFAVVLQVALVAAFSSSAGRAVRSHRVSMKGAAVMSKQKTLGVLKQHPTDTHTEHPIVSNHHPATAKRASPPLPALVVRRPHKPTQLLCLFEITRLEPCTPPNTLPLHPLGRLGFQLKHRRESGEGDHSPTLSAHR